ncbi:MAG: TIGR04283 family arsenosugar biosynthesis glycosyltransferase [Gemmataceae bacterium]|nr:TIGR04283 family arsenosugar biosynthesis glycosyltransferase [Gemmataceae bacterium]
MSVSVIIPTLNEASIIAEAIRTLRRQGPCQIIVADGGSTDGTIEAAREADRVLAAPRGRAAQMNAGAGCATGGTLLFLHADCSLEEGALAAAERCLIDPSVVAGCFHMHVQASAWLYRTVDWCATARVRLFGLIYGDQGLFVRRSDFVNWGGFPELRFMEDVFLSKKIRRLGRIAVLRERILVSPRRWQKNGIVRQTLRNWLLTGLAAAGVHPDKLARFYFRPL